MHRVDIQPVVALRRPSLVSLAQAAPASGAPGRHGALFRFEPDRDGLSAITVRKLILRGAAMIEVGIFEAKTQLSALLEKVSWQAYKQERRHARQSSSGE